MAALTEKGFQRPLYEELLAKRVERARALFGADIETDEKTPFGKYIRLEVENLAQAYEELERIYYAIFPNTATGSSLQRLVIEAGLNGRNPATRAVHRVLLTGLPGYAVPAGFLAATEDGLEFHTEQDTVLGDDGTAEALFYANEPGESGNVPAGSLVRIVEADARVTGLRHLGIEESGKDEETDPELRTRYRQARSGTGSSTADAIRAAVLRVSGVRACTVMENDGEETDAAGRPPGSFECAVFAPSELDAQIAQAIFRRKPAGIKAWGSVGVEVKDESGTPHLIRFSHILDKILYAKVRIAVDDSFPKGGSDQVKAEISACLDKLSNGADVILSRLYGPVLSVPGVCDVVSLELSADGETFSAANIPCTAMEAATIPPEHVTVEVETYEDQ
ncbi:baseplate J/gp47 family protein [Neglectibacter timonensis]|uniref:baseplate J/gp47 family protein n=1 Tax=Neglectibacter timonensis TaxID=1776382 RepID=UPI0039A2914E